MKALKHKEIIIKHIRQRIIDEHRKHRDLDWEEIAARKIYSMISDEFVPKNETDVISLLPEGFKDAHICHDGRLCENYASGLCSREPTSKSFSFYTTQEELEKLKGLFDITPKDNGA